MIDSAAGLISYGVFAVCVLAVLFSGAKVYGRIVERDNASYENRICVQYIETRIRQSRDPADAEIVTEDGCRALRLAETDGDKECAVYIYCHDGYLKELLLEEGADFKASAGEKIVHAEGMDLSVSAGMLTVTVSGRDGGTETLLVSLEGGT